MVENFTKNYSTKAITRVNKPIRLRRRVIQIGDKEGGDKRFVRTNRADPSLEESVTGFLQNWVVWQIAGQPW